MHTVNNNVFPGKENTGLIYYYHHNGTKRTYYYAHHSPSQTQKLGRFPLRTISLGSQFPSILGIPKLQDSIWDSDSDNVLCLLRLELPSAFPSVQSSFPTGIRPSSPSASDENRMSRSSAKRELETDATIRRTLWTVRIFDLHFRLASRSPLL